eukprot:Gb_28849 [translate_table: standard]
MQHIHRVRIYSQKADLAPQSARNAVFNCPRKKETKEFNYTLAMKLGLNIKASNFDRQGPLYLGKVFQIRLPRSHTNGHNSPRAWKKSTSPSPILLTVSNVNGSTSASFNKAQGIDSSMDNFPML